MRSRRSQKTIAPIFLSHLLVHASVLPLHTPLGHHLKCSTVHKHSGPSPSSVMFVPLTVHERDQCNQICAVGSTHVLKLKQLCFSAGTRSCASSSASTAASPPAWMSASEISRMNELVGSLTSLPSRSKCSDKSLRADDEGVRDGVAISAESNTRRCSSHYAWLKVTAIR